MQLAKELLERGERDTVIAYFDACAIFWTSKYNQINQWKQQLEKAAPGVFSGAATPSAREAELAAAVERMQTELEWLKKKVTK